MVSAEQAPTSVDLSKLAVGRLLGRGAFAAVFEGCYNGSRVAVKVPLLQLQPGKKDKLLSLVRGRERWCRNSTW